ncbi:hypothetical protein Kpol_457p2 [Vanderwaltozyma polyspora DSM 70294]|uniref:glucan endo-1,3-beta-D-glucosidase n=1 Tax=Vanderwaltozyma polyspora (strain ATCC 22028 / DSM 70294 / BCRC 21397 / CBS 2163 / NBRC 10782 / NRRL Y-8283 / UCD 57-17) TaxID=436907 RepID=A7TQU3_VANPO|nr:uncharacterized protein Kpol_457p2 [Vanderwaltozyma polyspora DSM 70294]EDO15351.1 hypothetical protein Kpol_457p2 [Vanderwaltozyma polyspora DSM 70294]
MYRILSVVLLLFINASPIASDEVTAAVYSHVGYSGNYLDVTNMDENTCQCTQQQYYSSGNLAPFNEELSVHFRGPVRLLQFGVYYPSGGTVNKREEITPEKGHIHKKKTEEEIAITSTLFSELSTPNPDTDQEEFEKRSSTSSAWQQSSYFSPGVTSNCVILNHQGDWSKCFGKALSYCASNGVDSATSPQALNDVTVGSNAEYIFFSGSQCSGNDCGYYRPSSTPAYHGFSGSDKMFVFEFSMPDDTSGNTGVENYNMPAIWFLNAKVPRTMQYGQSECSCWSSGCGEFDIFEIITSSSNELQNDIHDQQGSPGSAQGGGGTSGTFSRPKSQTMKGAVIFNGDDSTIHIVKLSDDTSFGSVIDANTVNTWLSASGSSASLP